MFASSSKFPNKTLGPSKGSQAQLHSGVKMKCILEELRWLYGVLFSKVKFSLVISISGHEYFNYVTRQRNQIPLYFCPFKVYVTRFKLEKAFIFSSRFSSKIPKLSLEQVQKMEFEAMFVFKEFFFSSLEMQRLSSTVD